MKTQKQPLLGFRHWAIRNNKLGAATHHYEWEPGLNHANCHMGHEAPARDCHCGFNAYYCLEDTTYGGVCGAIAGAGKVELHSNGFRSSEAQIIALLAVAPNKYSSYSSYYSKDELKEIEATYGVPVFTDKKEFLKYVRTKAKSIETFLPIFSKAKAFGKKILTRVLTSCVDFSPLATQIFLGLLLIATYAGLGFLNYFACASFDNGWVLTGITLLFVAIYFGLGLAVFRAIDADAIHINIDIDFLVLIAVVMSCIGIIAASCIAFETTGAFETTSSTTITIETTGDSEGTGDSGEDGDGAFTSSQSDLSFMAFLQLKYKQAFGEYTSIETLKSKVFPGDNVYFDIATEETPEGLLMTGDGSSVLLGYEVRDEIKTSCGSESESDSGNDSDSESSSDCSFDIVENNEAIAISFMSQLMSSYGTSLDIELPLSCLNGGETLFVASDAEDDSGDSDSHQNSFRANPVCLY